MPEHTSTTARSHHNLSPEENLIRRLVGEDATAVAEIIDRADASTSPQLLVAAAMLADDPRAFLTSAALHSRTTRDRQLVEVAAAHLGGDDDLLDALVRDHLADHPDNILAAWIAAHHITVGRPAS
jgi:hypothetical protein